MNRKRRIETLGAIRRTRVPNENRENLAVYLVEGGLNNSVKHEGVLRLDTKTRRELGLGGSRVVSQKTHPTPKGCYSLGRNYIRNKQGLDIISEHAKVDALDTRMIELLNIVELGPLSSSCCGATTTTLTLPLPKESAKVSINP